MFSVNINFKSSLVGEKVGFWVGFTVGANDGAFVGGTVGANDDTIFTQSMLLFPFVLNVFAPVSSQVILHLPSQVIIVVVGLHAECPQNILHQSPVLQIYWLLKPLP